ncbi:TXND3 protein, partial [Alcedo cyanopectus]|nr:TXND3 protein [Ceyx cyanopectus]
LFSLLQNGKIITMVRGANGPLLSKTITELVQEEREIAAGIKERAERNPLLNKGIFSYVLILINLLTALLFLFPFPEEVVRYSVGIIKPNDVLEGRVEEIKQKIRDAGFDIEKAEEKMLTEEQIREFYARNKDQPDFEGFVQLMMSGPCHILVISKKEGTDAIPHWRELRKASQCHMQWLNYRITLCFISLGETESILNICDVQDSVEDASRQLAFFFPNFGMKRTDERVEKTLALIRPCILKERRNSIMQRIKDDGFEIAMQKEIILSEEQVREFYREHVNENYFPVLLQQMTSGPTLVLALTRENAVAHWRDLLGPKTVEEAKKENPNSLRAQYAVNNVPIGQLHGSSTLLDAQKELEFFFPQEHT